MSDIEILFREDQQFRQPWLWVFLLMGSAVAMGTVVFFLMQLITISNADANPIIPFGVVVGLGLALFMANLFVVGIFGFAKFQTEVTTKGLFLRFFPFHRKVRMIALDELTDVDIAKVRPWADYGGYGIRHLRMATAYIVQGDRGVKLHYANGCHVFIGTKNPEALKEALDNILSGQYLSQSPQTR